MLHRFTDRARKVMALANHEAKRFNHEYIGTEHILLGLVAEGAGVGACVLKNLDVDLQKIRIEVEKFIKRGPQLETTANLPQTPRAKKVIEYAIEEAANLKHNYIGTEHLLLGLVREHDGVAAMVLINLGLRLDTVREQVLWLLGAGTEQNETAPPEDKSNAPNTASILAIGKILRSPETRKVIEYAIKEALNLNQEHVGAQHLLLGLLCDNDGMAAQLLARFGLDVGQVREEIRKLPPEGLGLDGEAGGGPQHP